MIGEVAGTGDLQVTIRGSTTLRARESVEVVPTQGVDDLELSVRNAPIVSPIDGLVTHRYVRPGQQAVSSQAIFEVADIDNLESRINIPERDTTRVTVGQSARLLREEGAAPSRPGSSTAFDLS